MYEFVDGAVLRVATHRPGDVVDRWPDLTGDGQADAVHWRTWLRQVSQSDSFVTALTVANPQLAQRITEIHNGARTNTRDVYRAVLAVTRYLVRATTRATPFGQFAGVAPVRVGRSPAVRIGSEHQVVTRPNGTRLSVLIRRLERRDDLRRRLLVVASNVAFLRDGRLVIDLHQALGDDPAGEPVEISVRHTRPVEAIVRLSRDPIRVSNLTTQLGAVFLSVPRTVIDRAVADLVDKGLLITNLRPPFTTPDPMGHLLAVLDELGADIPEDLRELVDPLRARHTCQPVGSKLRDLKRCDPTANMSARGGARTHAADDRVDLRLDADIVLPRSVVDEVAAAADMLVRLNPHPFGPPEWADYHGRFIERYGPGAVVRVADLVNPDTGLGFPSGYRGSLLGPPRPALSERDSAVLAMVQDAVVRGQTEIILDDRLISELAVDGAESARPQPHTELRVRLHSPSLAALGHGEFEVVVCGVSRAAGTTTGRFLDLFDPDQRQRFTRTFSRLPTMSEGAVLAQVSGPPLYGRADTVSRTVAVLPRAVHLNEHPDLFYEQPEASLRLDDLAVTADPTRLALLSISDGRIVEPLVFSAVEFVHHMHPLMRFLVELTTARATTCAPLSWGAAHRLPFLPRLRYRRTILSAARWNLRAADLPDRNASHTDWAAGLATWRQHYRVPRHVYLGDGDRRLGLDLTEQAHQVVLRRELRTQRAALREAPGPEAFGWIDGRAHEIVIPLATTGPPVPCPRSAARPIARVEEHPPGCGRWLYLKLFGHPDRVPRLLTAHLPALTAALVDDHAGTPPWWFLPYLDPEPHLRLRVRLDRPEDFPATAARVAAWTADLRRAGLIKQVQWDTYLPETGRFGTGRTLAAAETVFAADSAAVIAQHDFADQPDGPHRHAVLAASLLNLSMAATGDPTAGLRWMIDNARVPSGPALDRNMVRDTLRLADPQSVSRSERLDAAWTRRASAITAYRTVGSTQAVLPDLLHLHHVRMAGISPELERTCLRLARTAALSLTNRRHAPGETRT
jgi:thiopeptide-type bacteriocin biosynthesis protein